MPATRRRLLRDVLPVGLGLALAGCSEPDVEYEESNTGADEVAPGTDREPAVVELRNPAGDVVIEDVDAADASWRSRELLSDASTAESIVFADGVPSGDVESARSFLSETDFDSASIYVAELALQSCYRLRIQSVSWEPNRIEYRYCRELRPADERCEAGVREPVALFVRIPEPLEMDLRSSGSSGTSPCRSTDYDWERIESTGDDSATNATEPSETTDDAQETTDGGGDR